MNALLLGRLNKGDRVDNPDPMAYAGRDFFGVRALAHILQQAIGVMPTEPNPVTKTFPPDTATYTLVLHNGVLYWSTPPPPSFEHPPFVNGGYDWLTYETVLNKPKFRKTNQLRKIGLYAAEIDDMQVWLRDGMPPGSLNSICSAFFPDHETGEIDLISYGSWWWKQQKDLDTLLTQTAPYRKLGSAKNPAADIFPARQAESQEALVGSRNGLRLHLPRMVVMPYNFWDNDLGSNALGTHIQGPRTIPLLQVKTGTTNPQSWDMWRTASRSSIMKVNRVKPAGAEWDVVDWQPWPFGAAESERNSFKNTDTARDAPRYINDVFKGEVGNGAQFRLATRTDDHFSVKTGVCYVGFEKQASANKDVIGKDDEWIIGCMRSDIIIAIRRLAQARGAVADDILIQTEIMMVLERFCTGDPALGVDGVALRDLTVLDPAKVYIPPLSIPFIGTDMQTLTEEFANIDSADWCNFWQKNWAEALGRAKALFLVQYGMQHANPNVQNYLLEFPAGAPPTGPSRVVIRDVADALLAREVVWALFGEDSVCPPDEDAHAQLMNMSLPVLRFNFRSSEQGLKSETGSTDKQFGPPGIQFLWQRFSAHYAAQKPDKLNDCPAWKRAKVLKLMCSWLIGHSASYVRTVERALGVEFGAIRWDELLNPDHEPNRYLAPVTSLDDYESLGEADLKWEETAAGAIRDYFRDAGRAKICAYHNRGWKDAIPAFVVRLQDEMAQPLALKVLYYRTIDNSINGMRLTDSAGEVPFYSRSFTDFVFEVGRGAYTGTQGNWTIAKVPVMHVGTSGSTSTVKPTPPTPPVVTVTDPGPVAGASISLSASATADAGLTIAGVQFVFQGGNLGPQVTVAPYTTTLDTTTIKNGEYDLTATATDSAGATTTAATIRLKIDNPLPTLTFASPNDNDSIAGTAINVTVTVGAGAGMSLAQAKFTLDGADAGSIAAPGPYDKTFIATAGPHRIAAVAVDTAGNESPPALINVSLI
jgi:hypothetical protein